MFQSYYLANQLLDYSRTQVAWISSVQLTLTFAFSIFGGRYFDAHGTKLLVRLGWCCSIGALIGLACELWLRASCEMRTSRQGYRIQAHTLHQRGAGAHKGLWTQRQVDAVCWMRTKKAQSSVAVWTKAIAGHRIRIIDLLHPLPHE